ncbi:hypothetical protein N9882_04255, partial [Akkermansiaceae bacterium]|nr:hypothetical protein [Akkermansiaceae bacterium]
MSGKVISAVLRSSGNCGRFLTTIAEGLDSFTDEGCFFRREEDAIVTARRTALTELTERERNLKGVVIDPSFSKLSSKRTDGL